MPDNNKKPKDKYKAPLSYQPGGKNYEEGSMGGTRYYEQPVVETRNFMDSIPEGSNQRLAGIEANESPWARERREFAEKKKKKAMSGHVLDEISSKYKKSK